MAEIMFPVGRMVGGSLYKLFQRKNDDGSLKFKADGVTKDEQMSFGVAYAKDPQFPHWSQTPWGQQIMAVGAAGYPEQYQHPDFAWKVTDGDAKFSKKAGGKAPCSQEGYPGHWVIWFSQAWAPKIGNADGSKELTQTDAVVPGYFIQVLADVKDNKPSKSPGVYMNPKGVALSAYGQKIVSSGDVDLKSAGFGGGPLPAGASAVPIGEMAAPAPAALVIPGLPAPVAAEPAPAAPAPVVVAPNTTYMAAPAPIAPSAPAVPAPVAAAPRTVSNAQGQTVLYDDMIKQGWNDTLLAQHGWA